MQDKRTGHITADITPERIREALDAGHRVWVRGEDPNGENLRGVVEKLAEFHAGWNVALIDETPGGPYEGCRVDLFVRDLAEVTISA